MTVVWALTWLGQSAALAALTVVDLRWWSGPVAMGEATGGAAASVGRATASVVARIGSFVP